MSFGSYLLGNALSATYKPQATAGLAVDENGNFVDSNGQPTTPFVQPTFINKMLSPEAQHIAELNAQYGMAPTLAKQQAITTRSTAKYLDPTLTDQLYAQTYDPRFTPANRNTQTDAASFGATGAPTTVGTLRGQTDIDTANRNRQLAAGLLADTPTDVKTARADSLNSWAQAVKVDPLKIHLWAQKFAAANKREPTIEDAENNRAVIDKATTGAQVGALPNTTATIGNQAAIEAGTTGQEKANLPLTTGTLANDAMWQNIHSQYEPDTLVGTPYVSRLTPTGVTLSNGQLNPMFRPAAAATMQALSRGNYLGGNTTAPVITSSGNAYIKPTPVNPSIMTPTIGDAYKTPEQQQDEQDKIKEIQDSSESHRQAQHDAVQATIASKIAQLKAQQKILQAKHQRAGLLNILGNSLVDTDDNTNEIGSILGRASANLHPLRAINNLSNTLIGE